MMNGLKDVYMYDSSSSSGLLTSSEHDGSSSSYSPSRGGEEGGRSPSVSAMKGQKEHERCLGQGYLCDFTPSLSCSVVNESAR